MAKSLEEIRTDFEQAKASILTADQRNAEALGQIDQVMAALQVHISSFTDESDPDPDTGESGEAPSETETTGSGPTVPPKPAPPAPGPSSKHALPGPVTDANYGRPRAVYNLDVDATVARMADPNKTDKLIFQGGDPMAEPNGAEMFIPPHPQGKRWPGFNGRVRNPKAGTRFVLNGISATRVKMGPCLPVLRYDNSTIPMAFEARNLDCLLPDGSNKGAFYAINFSLAALYNVELQSKRNGLYWSGSSPEGEVFADLCHIHHSGGSGVYHGAYGKWTKWITIQRSLVDAIRENGHALKLYAEHVNILDNDIATYRDPADMDQYWGYWPQLDISNWAELLCAGNTITREPAPAGKFQKGRMVDLRNRWYEGLNWTNGYNMRPLLQTTHDLVKIFRDNIIQNNAADRSNEALIMNRGTDWARANLGGDPAPADTVTTPQRSVIDFDGSNQVLGHSFPQLIGLDLNNDGKLD